MAKLSGITATSITYQEAAAPSTPAATKWVSYFKTDGQYYKDDAGVEVGPLAAATGATTTLMVVETEAYHNTTQSVNSATDTAVLFNTETTDDGAMHSTVSNTSRFTVGAAQADKAIRIVARITIPAIANQFQCWVAKNGTEVGKRVRLYGTTSSIQTLAIEHTARAADHVSTDYYEVYIKQSSGSAQNIGHATADANNWIQIISG